MMLSPTNLVTGIPSSKVRYSRPSSAHDGDIDLEFKKTLLRSCMRPLLLWPLIIASLLLTGYTNKGLGVGGVADRAMLP